MSSGKLGIIGGSFDPIHIGHLHTAEFAYRQLQMDKIIFIPAYIAPHKIGMEFAAAADRYKMTELAVADYECFEVSDIELKRCGISYTYDTIMELKRMYPGADLHFIIGADSVPQLTSWHRIKELLSEVTFLAAERPGYNEVIDQAEALFGELGKQKIVPLAAPEMAVSSTAIRNLVLKGKSITGMVPKSVERYILDNGLYR